VTQKKLSKPAWYKNTYFWIAAVLLGVGIIGFPFLGGDKAIRDPGQKREDNLFVIYFVASAVMTVNGIMSHRLMVRQFEDQREHESQTEKK
jgi:hypothetical protein